MSILIMPGRFIWKKITLRSYKVFIICFVSTYNEWNSIKILVDVKLLWFHVLGVSACQSLPLVGSEVSGQWLRQRENPEHAMLQITHLKVVREMQARKKTRWMVSVFWTTLSLLTNHPSSTCRLLVVVSSVYTILVLPPPSKSMARASCIKLTDSLALLLVLWLQACLRSKEMILKF